MSLDLSPWIVVDVVQKMYTRSTDRRVFLEGVGVSLISKYNWKGSHRIARRIGVGRGTWLEAGELKLDGYSIEVFSS